MADVPVFGRRLALVRERRGLLQEELAVRARTTPQTISRLERGAIKDPGLQLVTRLAIALDASIDFLAGRYNESERRTVGLVTRGRQASPTARPSGKSEASGWSIALTLPTPPLFFPDA